MTTLNLDNFSKQSRAVLDRAQNLARKRRHKEIDPVHALISLLLLDGGPLPSLLEKLGANTDAMVARLQDELGLLPRAYAKRDSLFVSDQVIATIEAARKHAGARAVEPTDLLYGFTVVRGLVSRILKQSGVTRQALDKTLGASPSASTARGKGESVAGPAGLGVPQDLARSLEVLEQYGRDMTAMADAGEFDPVVGRGQEIRRIMQVLSRRHKNNPILIGEPGVGKTAIVEALCQRFVDGDVPERLKGRRIYSLDMGTLLAGTSLRGQFEERMKSIVDAIRASSGHIIVYIDEIHNMVGAGQEGAGSAANLLKPALARGEFRCIGTTTLEEYKGNIEDDKALVRRFQEIHVPELTVDESIAVLRGVKKRYEIHHGVRITDAALVSAAKLGQRYITDRNLPDKAIDLVDEAGSRLRLEIDSKPTEVDALERQIQNLEIQRAALAGEDAAEAKDDLSKIGVQVETLSREVARLSEHWQREKAVLEAITELTSELEATEKNIERAKRDKDLGRASELRYSVLPKIEKGLEARNEELAGIQKDMRLLKQDVEASDIGDVVSEITGIPVSKMMEGERERLLKMEGRLRERVVGQTTAIRAIAAAVRRSRAGVSDPHKPIGNFFFVGPTGVGKTELAKALAVFLFDSEDALIRIDMSEYQEQAKVNTLIGSARGYVGSEKGGVLTEAVRRKPYSVVLFDEAEKAHPKVFDLLLQVMDEGRLTDSQGLEVDFTNTIVIMTSNVGSRQILDMTGKLSNEEMEAQIMLILRDHFKPEFLNRIDDIVVFSALQLEAIRLIVDIQMRRLSKILAEQKLTITLSDQAKQWLAEAGFEPEYGARPLKRAILNHIQDPLSTMILEGVYTKGDTISVDVSGDGSCLTFDGEYGV